MNQLIVPSYLPPPPPIPPRKNVLPPSVNDIGNQPLVAGKQSTTITDEPAPTSLSDGSLNSGDSDWDDDDDFVSKKISIRIKPIAQTTPNNTNTVDELKAIVGAWRPMDNLNGLVKTNSRRTLQPSSVQPIYDNITILLPTATDNEDLMPEVGHPPPSHPPPPPPPPSPPLATAPLEQLSVACSDGSLNSDSDWSDDDNDDFSFKKIKINIKPITQLTPDKQISSVDELKAVVGSWKQITNVNLVKPNSRRNQCRNSIQATKIDQERLRSTKLSLDSNMHPSENNNYLESRMN